MTTGAHRILLKTATYGTLHVCVAIFIAYAITGSLMAALGIGLIEPVVQAFVFALHESVWEHKNFWRTLFKTLKIGKGKLD
ncbi:MAG: DUF2061 domain-containing protein [Rhodospirillales bacterium]|nr:DUF2061 domain-containing protein [Rhodospirillales bacterium]